MDEKEQKIIEQIKKLLNIAADKRGNANEMQLALALANKLITRHKIAEYELRDTARNPFEIVTRKIKLGARKPAEIDFIRVLLSNFYEVETSLIYERAITTELSLEIHGTESDLEIAEYVYEFLSREMRRLAAQERRQNPNFSKRSFYLGFYAGLSSKLKEAKRQNLNEAAQRQRESYELVLKEKSEAIAQYQQDRHRNLKKMHSAKSRARSDARSYYSGLERGKETNIAATIA